MMHHRLNSPGSAASTLAASHGAALGAVASGCGATSGFTHRGVRTVARIAAATAAALLVAGLAACASTASTDPIGTWGSQEQGHPHLIFTDDSQVSGNDGCNILRGDWSLDGDTIDFGVIVSTMRYCDGVDTWLVNADTAKVDGSTLHVYDDTGAEIGTLERG